MGRPLVLHDADCGFCAKCARWIPRIGARVDVSSLQAEDLTALGVDAERSVAEMPVVMPNGTVEWGHRAWAEILKAGAWPLRLAGWVLGSRLMERPASWVYAKVAGNRHKMPGSDGTCALPPRPANRAQGEQTAAMSPRGYSLRVPGGDDRRPRPLSINE